MARDRLSDSVGGSDISLSELYAVELREDLRGCGACLAIAVLRTRLLAFLLGCKRACSPTETQGGGCEVLRLRGMLRSHGDPREVRPHRALIARYRSLPPSPINDHEPSMRKTGAAYLATRSPRRTGLLTRFRTTQLPLSLAIRASTFLRTGEHRSGIRRRQSRTRRPRGRFPARWPPRSASPAPS